jgi:hypothetical protein
VLVGSADRTARLMQKIWQEQKAWGTQLVGYADADELTVTGLDDYDRVASALAASPAAHEATA